MSNEIAASIMTEDQLRDLYMQVYKFIVAERVMRERVFPAGHKSREAKLAACDKAMDALVDMKDFAKQHTAPAVRQAVLVDEPRKGGY